MGESAMLRNLWVLIPARGGSKGISRKNLRNLAGKPLVLHTVQELSKVFGRGRIIVSTDDEEIVMLCQEYALIHNRPSHLATDQATLDEVATNVANWLLTMEANADDVLLTVQPTSPFLKAQTVIKAFDLFNTGVKSVISVTDDRHLRWTRDQEGNPKPLFSERVNRQWLPPVLAETGGVIASRIGDIVSAQTRIQYPVALLEVDEYEGLDIDSYADWATAEYYARRKRIVIRVDASAKLGMGHVYRAIAIAHELSEHVIKLVTRRDGDYVLGYDFLRNYPYDVEFIEREEQFFEVLEYFHPDIVILDVLDTLESYVREIRNLTKTVVSLEDLGSGARFADVVINDLYTDLYPQHNHWYGVEYAILGPKFEVIKPRQELNADVENIMIAFGGTDPQNLTLKALSAIAKTKYSQFVTVVLGPGYTHPLFELAEFGLKGEILRSVSNMPLVIQKADLALTSAGRTVTELMVLGVPTLVMCQNPRELRHTHASSPFGVINLGLGEYVETETLSQHISMLVNDSALRKDMRMRALNATRNRSNSKIVQRILEVAFQECQD